MAVSGLRPKETSSPSRRNRLVPSGMVPRNSSLRARAERFRASNSQQLHRIADGHSPAPNDVSVEGQPPAHLLDDPS